MTPPRFLTTLTICALAACSQSQVFDGDGGPDAGRDAGRIVPDAGGFPDAGALVDSGPADLGIPLPPPGTVICGGHICGSGEACCFASLTCFSPASSSCSLADGGTLDAGPGGCLSNADCAASELCSAAVGRCAGAGVCVARAALDVCPGSPPVCGCDGRTYPTQCGASNEGVRVAATGACGSSVYPDPTTARPCDPTDPTTCGPAMLGFHCDATTRLCAPNGMTIRSCDAVAGCPTGTACCEAIGLCLDASRPDLCSLPPEGTVFPCHVDADCMVPSIDSPDMPPIPYYCDGPGGCGGPGGGCTTAAHGCGGELDAVCGCDGISYSNPCWASNAATRVAHAGMCP